MQAMSDDHPQDHVPFGSDANGPMPSGGTGRLLVTMQPGEITALHDGLRELAGLRSARSADFDAAGGATAPAAAIHAWQGSEGDALVFDMLGVALVHADAGRSSALRKAALSTDPRIRSVEPEQYLRALAAGEGTPQPDLQAMTWGVYLTQAWRSPSAGAGIRIAMLDTGFDLGHPDFTGRDITSQSFVPGSPVQDRHGHGTHTTGTACGPRMPAGTARRYGIASDATLLVGKVLNDAGWCEEGWVLAGMDWALRNRADLISLSLGWHVSVGEAFKQAFEQAGQAALDAGCVVIAAAGNDGNAPVYRPANCPSIFAVGALDNAQQRADFSCLGLNPHGGEVDIAGPGVDVYSTAPMPARYRLMKGTSMATPHVTGCAALWAENHGVRGRELWKLMRQWASTLQQAPQSVGVGLVQAPW
ncbi:hypothetical protein BH11PSE14_BH11PSE14_23620 [soil metagenome]